MIYNFEMQPPYVAAGTDAVRDAERKGFRAPNVRRAAEYAQSRSAPARRCYTPPHAYILSRLRKRVLILYIVKPPAFYWLPSDIDGCYRLSYRDAPILSLSNFEIVLFASFYWPQRDITQESKAYIVISGRCFWLWYYDIEPFRFLEIFAGKTWLGSGDVIICGRARQYRLEETWEVEGPPRATTDVVAPQPYATAVSHRKFYFILWLEQTKGCLGGRRWWKWRERRNYMVAPDASVPFDILVFIDMTPLKRFLIRPAIWAIWHIGRYWFEYDIYFPSAYGDIFIATLAIPELATFRELSRAGKYSAFIYDADDIERISKLRWYQGSDIEPH